MSPVTRELSKNLTKSGNDPRLVEDVQGINVQTGRLQIANVEKKFYVPHQPPILLCYIAGQDFELPNGVQAVGEVGVAVIDNTCSVYGAIQIGEADMPGIEIDLPSEVVPLFPVYQNALMIEPPPGGEGEISNEDHYYPVFISVSLSGKLTVRGTTPTYLISAHTTIHFGPVQYVKW